jgi:hypothetical protein
MSFQQRLGKLGDIVPSLPIPRTNVIDHNDNSRSWLRHCTTNRKVAGSIPDEVPNFSVT